MILAWVSPFWNINTHKIKKSHWQYFPFLAAEKSPRAPCRAGCKAGMALGSSGSSTRHFGNSATTSAFFGWVVLIKRKKEPTNSARRGEKQLDWPPSLCQAIGNSFLKCPVIKQQHWFTQTPKRATWRDSSLLDWSYPYISSFRKQMMYLCLFQWWRLQVF